MFLDTCKTIIKYDRILSQSQTGGYNVEILPLPAYSTNCINKVRELMDSKKMSPMHMEFIRDNGTFQFLMPCVLAYSIGVSLFSLLHS